LETRDLHSCKSPSLTGAVQALPMTKRSLVHLVQRALLVVKGADSRQFLQGLTTNDLRLLHKSGALYTLLLNNRGRIEYDLIVYEGVDGLLVECDNQRRDALKRLLEVYRMHKAVSIEKCGMNVFFVENVYDGAVVDPRVPAFGSRLLSDGLPDSTLADASLYDERRLEFGIAEGDIEVRGALPVYRNADLMHGMSDDKGCYLGQEMSARTLRAAIKKRVLPFTCDGAAKGRVMDADGHTNMGEVLVCNGHRGLALLRLDQGDVTRCLKAGDVDIRPFVPSWWPANAISSARPSRL
uniref:Aminomethyltransferase folate-binding domain-containing protein n=1 Tax=Parascaris univalens TaxID=6257 RepID=A0A915BQ86_PARUN